MDYKEKLPNACHTIQLSQGSIVNRILGLYRIYSDLLTLTEIIKDIIASKKEGDSLFNAFQAPIILYRKCFASRKEGLSPLSNKQLKNASSDQKILHARLIELGNKHVAHAELEIYDQSFLSLVIENDSEQAIAVHVTQHIYEPLSLNDIKNMQSLVELIKTNLSKSIQEAEQGLIHSYNNEIKKNNIQQLEYPHPPSLDTFMQ